MINKILDTVINSLSKEAFLETQSKDELKAIYTLLQILRIWTFIIFSFSIINGSFIEALLNPQNSLLEWSHHHRYVIRITNYILVYLPTFCMFLLVSYLSPVAESCYEKQPVPWLSPKKIIMISIFIMLIASSIMGMFYSFINY